MRYTLRFVFLPLILCMAVFAQAQGPVQSPEEFLGYGMGERFTPHHRIVDYARHLAAASNRVELTEYGVTSEGRPLVYLTISTSGNLASKEEIRQNNLKLTGLVEGSATANKKAIVWLSYNVHGNEAVASEAALWTMWELADPDNAKTGAWLENTVVLVDPCLNPDGRDRYVVWYHQMMGVAPNPIMESREHSEPWPGGRPNHYYFDMNRDWAWQTQLESKARAAAYQTWMPHVHIDFHEMGINSPYFMAPSADPFHEYVTPWQREFQTTIGMKNVKYFDQNSWLYYTRESFDLFAPSYGDTWPVLNGAIGITVEQGGSGQAGLAGMTAIGDTLTFYERVIHQHVTGMASVEATAEHHTNVIREFEKFFEMSRTNAPGDYKAYLIKGSNNSDDLKRFTDWLDANFIRYGYASGGASVNGFSFMENKNQSVRVENGDLVINVNQPKGVQISVLFEPRTTVVDSLTYDFTAWSVPYVRGLDAYALSATLSANGSPKAAATAPALPAKPYTYIAEHKSINDSRFLADLAKQGVRVRFTTNPFTIDGKSFEPGTLIINRGENLRVADFDGLVRSTAQKHGRALHGATTGFVDTGSDFGSNSLGYVGQPRVLTAAGQGTASGSVGEIWYFFEQDLGYPVTLVNADRIGSVDLSNYDILVLGSSIGAFSGESGRARLLSWVRDGGKLILLGNAVSMVAGSKEFEDITFKRANLEESTDPQPGYANRRRESMTTGIAGSIYRHNLDNTHPLAYGYGTTYYSMKLSSQVLNYSTNGWNVGVVPKGAHTAGFVGYKIKPVIEESASFIVTGHGRGTVILLHDNPLYRGFWEAGKLMMANAVFFVGN